MIKSKYFYAITLLSLSLLAVLFQIGVDSEPNGSIQMSSSMTDYANAHPQVAKTSIEQYYDLQLSLLENYSVTVQNKLLTFHKGDVISVSVPLSTLNGQTNPSQVNLNSVISKLTQNSGTPYTGNEMTIEDTENEALKSLIGEDMKLDLRSLAKKLKIKSISETEEEDIDEPATDGGVCVDCVGLDPFKPKTNAFDALLKTIYNGGNKVINTIEDAVKAFVNSDSNKKLLAKIKSGFTMRLGKNWKTGKQITLRDGVVSDFHRKCLRGVKMALLQSGVVDTYPVEEKAKYFGPVLEKNGFMNLLTTDYKSKIKTPCDVPPGAIIVYSGGKAGHAEIRTNQGFMSDYFSKDSRIGCTSGLAARGRRVTGVYIQKTPEVNMYLALNSKGSKNERAN